MNQMYSAIAGGLLFPIDPPKHKVRKLAEWRAFAAGASDDMILQCLLNALPMARTTRTKAISRILNDEMGRRFGIRPYTETADGWFHCNSDFPRPICPRGPSEVRP
jgi:hypothetical protein